MFDHTSRYYALPTSTWARPDGREIPYVLRRFLPQPDSLALLVRVNVTQGDRLDLIAARTLGVPDQYWQVCDANHRLNPFELTGDASVGTTVRVPMPQTPPVQGAATG
ncbi:LysM domain-containing protein [Caballeronia sp. SEWSISQ10-4 2]|uniref:LysM domain-containing protein n=1 Tax=Caballeronia sp. SEWSISQ10-4 2 TaxID=2937438 RepID=UPI00265238A1|nr:LysM domain-containing protein [Caballeronia sp. SEWSISQ10-4 2]MDN7179627.1 LysM domain-containing protein [Caballeronia sp. SEWSISQ10-4 2]